MKTAVLNKNGQFVSEKNSIKTAILHSFNHYWKWHHQKHDDLRDIYQFVIFLYIN
jgi:hypothetical protein